MCIYKNIWKYVRVLKYIHTYKLYTFPVVCDCDYLGAISSTCESFMMTSN